MADATRASSSSKALVLVSQARSRLVAMPPRRRNSLAAALACLLAIVLGAAWYASRPDWRVLFSGLEARDVQQISQELAAAGISFQSTPDGTGVEVPAEFLDKARMEVAAKGMPESGRLGFELFDKPNWVGSEFDERVNYQRALEGELEHTIASLGAVRSARVHLVLPQQGLFSGEEKAAKASVVLKLKRANLDAEQGDSIRNLVAGAVESLAPEQVTLVDADGRVNLQPRGRTAHESDLQAALESRLIAMLEPLAGAGNVRATVNLAFDEGTEERTDEVFDPTHSAALTQQKSEQSNGVARQAQGVPGTASNAPAAAPAGAVQGSAAAAAPGTPPLLEKPVFPAESNSQSQTRTEESGTYAVTRHLSHIEQGPGRITRISAAVVVNDRELAEGAGKAEHDVWKPRSSEEMHRLEQLAQAAVGFDEKRGDQVVMENVSFSTNLPEPHPAGTAQVVERAWTLLHAQPGLFKNATFGLLGILVIWFVLRPLAGQVVATLAESGKEPALLESASNTSSSRAVLTVDRGENHNPDLHVDSLLAQPAPQSEPVRRPQPHNAGAAVFQQVSDHIRREPAQSTRLLEAWIGASEEGN